MRPVTSTTACFMADGERRATVASGGRAGGRGSAQADFDPVGLGRRNAAARHLGDVHADPPERNPCCLETLADGGDPFPGEIHLVGAVGRDSIRVAIVTPVADFFTVSAILTSFAEAASERWSEPGAKTIWFGFAAASAAAGGASVIAGSGADVESVAVGGVVMPLPRMVPSTIPAMATTTSNATAAIANVRDEFRVGGVCRASMSVPGSAATDSSWR